MSDPTFRGVLVPAATPFGADLAPDTAAEATLLEAVGAAGLALPPD